MTRTRFAVILATLGIILAVFLAAGGWLVWVNSPTGRRESVTIDIEMGLTADSIAKALHEQELIRSVTYFKHLAGRRGYARNFKAGRHTVDGTMSTARIAELLTLNPPSPPDCRVTVFEGLTIRETASILVTQAQIDSSRFVEFASDSVLSRELGIDNATLEGYLYPDTYFVRRGTAPMEMITRMVNQFKTVFSDSFTARAHEIGMSVSEVVILASIIEAEAGLEKERPLISAVLHKRLKLNRPLEANPTIQYALGEKRRVLNEDLKIESPFNTYTNTGLPPGPIASPGVTSLLAALYPADTQYLYFMADGKGGHVFSKTLQEHTRAVREFRKMRKKKRLSHN